MVEHERQRSPRLPANWQEQIASMPSVGERYSLITDFHRDVSVTLAEAAIPVILTSSRVLNEPQIRRIVRRRTIQEDIPVPNIYGTTFVLGDDSFFDNASRAIITRFNAPEVYPHPWNLKSVVDYREITSSDPSRDFFNAVFVYVPFGEVGPEEDKMRNIGEVQLLTPESLQMADRRGVRLPPSSRYRRYL